MNKHLIVIWDRIEVWDGVKNKWVVIAKNTFKEQRHILADYLHSIDAEPDDELDSLTPRT